MALENKSLLRISVHNLFYSMCNNVKDGREICHDRNIVLSRDHRSLNLNIQTTRSTGHEGKGVILVNNVMMARSQSRWLWRHA